MNYIKFNHLNPASYHAFEPGEGRTSNSDLDLTVLSILAAGVVVLILVSIYIESEKCACQITNNKVS
jgi:hypothetical protein